MLTLTVIDLKNAMSGDHTLLPTIGHDYRGGVARFVAAAYRLECDDSTLARIEAALRDG